MVKVANAKEQQDNKQFATLSDTSPSFSTNSRCLGSNETTKSWTSWWGICGFWSDMSLIFGQLYIRLQSIVLFHLRRLSSAKVTRPTISMSSWRERCLWRRYSRITMIFHRSSTLCQMETTSVSYLSSTTTVLMPHLLEDKALMVLR